MKKLLLAMAAAVILTAPARAADMPVKAPPPVAAAVYNWTGLYLGVNGGWGRGTLDWLFLSTNTTENRSFDGWLLGGHAGYQIQFGQWVVGAEFNGLAARMDESPVCLVNPGFRCATDVRKLFTVGPRAGIAFNNVLIYGTGGFVWTSVRTEAITVATGALFWRGKETHQGWFGGGGIEYGITPNFIVGIEATYVNLRDELIVPVTPAGLVVNGDRHVIDGHFTTIRGRLTYKFGGGGPIVARY